MARTVLPVTNAVANSGVNNPTATTIDQANGMVITMPSSDIPSDASTDRLVLVVSNTAGTAKNAIVRAGANATYLNVPAVTATKGDITVSVGASQTAYIGPFEWSRVNQGGTINVDFASGITGTIIALLLPRAV